MAVKATPVKSTPKEDLTGFAYEDGRRVVEYLYVDAENEADAIQQAQRIVITIFRF